MLLVRVLWPLRGEGDEELTCDGGRASVVEAGWHIRWLAGDEDPWATWVPLSLSIRWSGQGVRGGHDARGRGVGRTLCGLCYSR